MKKLILLFAFLTASTMMFAQLYEIPLNRKIDESQLIVEGKVIESQSYTGKDDKIYTAHKIGISRIFKETDFRERQLTIVTRGGQVDDRITTWTHLLTLEEGESGIFFLRGSSYPQPTVRGFPNQVYDVFSSSQGFLKFTNNIMGLEAVCQFQKYRDIETDLIIPIQRITGEIPRVVPSISFDKEKEGKDKCVVIYLEPAHSPNPQTIAVDIKVSSLEGSFELYKSSLVFKYDTDFFGANIVSNNALTLEDGLISSSNSYALSATDLATDKLEIKLEFTGSPNELFTLTEQKSWLARAYLTLGSLAGQPDIVFDYEIMEQENQYYDPVTQRGQPFRCVKVKNELFPVACPIILSFDPPTAAAGVGEQSLNDPPIPGIITIVGENLGTPSTGEYKPSHMRLGFTNAGPSGADWCFPPERDIISWSEDTIVVRVPSINEDGDIKTYAGTGQLLIWNTLEDCFSYSVQSLYIPFCVTNLSNLYTASQTRESILTKMVNANEEGGYDLYFGDDILTLDSVEQSFERALNTWRCTTKVNMVVKPKSEIADLSEACLIDMDTTLPTGVITTLAVTRRAPEKCDDNSHSYQPKFDMLFSKYVWRLSDSLSGTPPIEINWWTSETPMSPSMDIFPNRDFQTVALHELGHASMLLHTKNSDNVMFTPHAGTKRALTLDDLEGGIHTVELSVIDPHCDLKMTKYDCTTNLVSEVPKLKMKIFPNPTNTAINLEFEKALSGRIVIFDALGKELLSKRIEKEIYSNLKVDWLSDGIYFIAVIDELNQVLNHSKIIKQ